MFEAAPRSWRMEVEPIAIRGSRLSLTRARYRDIDDADRPIAVELLHVMELSDDDLMHDTVIFDPDDIDAAFAELDARYLAGEAAAHAHTWSVVARAFATLNPRQLPPTIPDWVHIDNRRGLAYGRRHDPVRPRHVGCRARHHDVHRGCASADRSRSRCYLGVVRDLARGLRGRVAGDQHPDARRRLDHPRRDFRRGRPRCCACDVRRTQRSGAAT